MKFRLLLGFVIGLILAAGRPSPLELAAQSDPATEIFQLVNEAYSELSEFTPMSDGEIDALIKKFFSFIDPGFVKLVVDKDEADHRLGHSAPDGADDVRHQSGQLRGTTGRDLLDLPSRRRGPRDHGDDG